MHCARISEIYSSTKTDKVKKRMSETAAVQLQGKIHSTIPLSEADCLAFQQEFESNGKGRLNLQVNMGDLPSAVVQVV